MSEAVDWMTFFGGDRLTPLPEAEQMTAARQADVQRELREALAGAKERHIRKVGALRVDQSKE